MNQQRFSALAHTNHTFCNPMSTNKMNKVLSKIPLNMGEHVLDVGAGKYELLFQLAEKYGVEGTGIEISKPFIKEAKNMEQKRSSNGSIQYIEMEALEFMKINQAEYSLSICLGASHALVDYPTALKHLKAHTKHKGYILIGEGYWKKKPELAYLEALGGAMEDEMLTHAGNVAAAEELGLIPLWSVTANEDEWDDYEWLYSSSIEKYFMEHPDDPDAEAFLAKIRSWRRTYLHWGRDTLGFGLYLFQNQK
ncbi:SAM-dependent methyltransferase [Falsibacillus albus]|uniref:Class I SAM-dependent methyltransferase n=1 Tax=Falsibacillus albus TaxID=2478915 RepID=A0A3L7K2Y1_9BACI|nr:class I SAM-dependent methyltransferase [Falsibacillus albus]RLQ97393.1 class I SAM-dependent methyltransferase [Falsibacillus albus]